MQEKTQDLATLAVPGSEKLLTVVNEELDKGPLHSIHLGLDELGQKKSNILLVPVDFPFIKPSTIRVLLDRSSPDSIVIPVFDGKRGHPPLFGSGGGNDQGLRRIGSGQSSLQPIESRPEDS